MISNELPTRLKVAVSASAGDFAGQVMVDRRGAHRASRAELSVPVAVGTILTDRPPHRSVRARLRIRLF